MLGATLALVSAGFFGLNNAAVRRGVLKASVMQAMAVTVPLGVPIFIGFALAMGGFKALADWRLEAWIWMILAGLVHFVIGRYGNYRATQALGATLSAPIQQLSILIAVGLAMTFLGETLTPMMLIGMALVVGGPMVLIRRRAPVGASARAKASGFEPDWGPGLGWGAVCALGYGTSPLLIALALGAEGTVADSVAGVLVSYIAASVAVGVLVVLTGTGGPRGVDRASLRWFVLSALLVAVSQLFRYMALAVAPVAVVVPIQRLSVVFRLLASAAINRDHEVFDIWVVASILLALLGAVALSVDSGLLAELLRLPGGIGAALSAPLL